MTQRDKVLNCSNCRIGDFKQSLCDCHNGFCAKYKGIGTEKDFFKAIEALSTETKQGEWICKGDYAVCSKCGGSSGTQFDGVERIPRITAFCPNCGAMMRRVESEVEE